MIVGVVKTANIFSSGPEYVLLFLGFAAIRAIGGTARRGTILEEMDDLGQFQIFVSEEQNFLLLALVLYPEQVLPVIATTNILRGVLVVIILLPV